MLKSKRKYKREEFSGSQWCENSFLRKAWRDHYRNWLREYQYKLKKVPYRAEVFMKKDAMPDDDPRIFKWKQIMSNPSNQRYQMRNHKDGRMRVPYYLNEKDSRTVQDCLNKQMSYMRRRR